jgi:hypothetical protein
MHPELQFYGSSLEVVTAERLHKLMEVLLMEIENSMCCATKQCWRLSKQPLGSIEMPSQCG